MIHFDLEHFVETGMLGPFTTRSTRQEITDLLGDAEPGSYPGFANYGHLSFDPANGIGSTCLIQIGFPHPSHMKPANPEWKNWTPPTCFDNWPDQRFKWTLGRIVPGFSIEDATRTFDHLVETEMIYASNGLRILHNPNSWVELCFQNDENTGKTTLSSVVAHPNLIAE